MNRLAVIVMAAALVAAMLPSSAQDYMSREYMLKDTSFSKQLTREQGRALCDDILAAMQDADGEWDEIRVQILPYESLLVFGHKYPESSLKSVSEVYDALVEAASSEK